MHEFRVKVDDATVGFLNLESDRIEAAIRGRKDQAAREILRGLAGDPRKFTRGAAQHDDTTIFVLKVAEDS